MGESTGKFMVAGFIVVSCFVMIIVFFLLLYIKWFWSDTQEGTPTNPAPITIRRRRLDFSGGHREITISPKNRKGLELSILESLPSIIFINKDFEERLECSVCLSTISDGETTRILPTCSHGFHMECIDMWFQAHSTCPLCRSPVSSPSKGSDLRSSTLMEHGGDVNQTFPNIV